MFKKIVSNLPFSPALVGQLSFYAKRLRKEEATRRLGLIFTVLALIVQSFAVFQPPEAANAASSADFVSGGVTSVSDFLKSYDNNSRNIKTLFTSLGITRDEIKAAKSSTVGKSGYYNWSMTSLYSYGQGQRSYTFYNSAGTKDTVYNRPIQLTQEGKAPYPVYVGQSKKFGWFAIKKDCGNLITKKRPEEVKPPASSCNDLSAVKLERTKFRFDAKASVSNGAKIKSYTFTVKNANGTTVTTKTVSSSSQSASYTYSQTKTGSYTATVQVDTSLGVKKDSDCKASFTVAPTPTTPVTPQQPTPMALCSSLSVAISDRTNIEMSGSAITSGGATISNYTFTIKDSNGNTIATKNVATNQQSARADAVTISTPGAYDATLVVNTSLGTKSSANCARAFSIVKPAVCAINPSLPVSSPDCQPCPGNPDIWIKDADCDADIIQTKTASNIDQHKDAATTLARASDRIAYTVKIENKGFTATTVPMTEKLGDVLEYASLIDKGGGSYDAKTKTLSWSNVTVKPGDSQERTFVVRVASKIPATNTGKSDQASYDCVMTNTFGNSIDVDVDCPAQKVIVEQVTSELPTTGPTENMLFAGGLLAVVAYFYARARQVNKEIRLIRRDVNAGTI